mmetsp:Transcript_1207/g.1935  ORF Transcript_1207/g.1935 Transcript_1207/m.1935 type:complete len:89 (+) Transcript_1207:2-268(+)
MIDPMSGGTSIKEPCAMDCGDVDPLDANADAASSAQDEMVWRGCFDGCIWVGGDTSWLLGWEKDDPCSARGPELPNSDKNTWDFLLYS